LRLSYYRSDIHKHPDKTEKREKQSMTTRNASFNGTIPENYDRYLGPILFEPYAAELAAQLDVAEGATVLELACGTGIVTRRLLKRLGSRAKLMATDLNEAMLNVAQAKLGNQPMVEWKQVDATELPFKDQSFDAVVCQFALMFFPEKEKAAAEVWRVLKPGGTFLFSVWDAIELNDFPRTAHEVIGGFFEDSPPDFYDVPFSFFERARIQSLLTATGFDHIQVLALPLTAEAASANAVARGLLYGNPIITAIKERDESRIPEIEAALTNAIAAKYGAAPTRASMQAVICSARRPS
jgi:ubiquinone/menaquinone biosynthesis C-methylase UbiE